MENDEIDDNFDTHPPAIDVLDYDWDSTDDIDNDPTIYAKMGGRIKAEFTSGISSFVHVLPPNAVKIVKINVYIIQDSNGSPFVSPTLVKEQIELAKTIYQQAGLAIIVDNLLPDGSFEEVMVNSIDFAEGLTYAEAYETMEAIELINQVKDISETQKVDLIFVNYLNSNPGIGGSSINDYFASTAAWEETHKRTCIIGNTSTTGVLLSTRPFITAHEIGHVLTNEAHYILNYDDPDSPANHPNQAYYNLMIADGTSPINFTTASKRLWSFQVDWARTKTDIPQQ